MPSVLGGRSEEKLQLRPCVSFGHSCCEWTSVPGNQPVVCISIMLPVHWHTMWIQFFSTSLFGLRFPIYFCDWPQQSPAAFRLYFCFTVSVSALSSPSRHTQKYKHRHTVKTALRMNLKTKQNTFRRIFGPGHCAERERLSLLGF